MQVQSATEADPGTRDSSSPAAVADSLRGRSHGPRPTPTSKKKVRLPRRESTCIPLILMSATYAALTYFLDTIGLLTSAPGFFNLSADPGLRGWHHPARLRSGHVGAPRPGFRVCRRVHPARASA
ncbi:MAG: hypothetical protein R3A52_16375 [Polyangiales bacterium]